MTPMIGAANHGKVKRGRAIWLSALMFALSLSLAVAVGEGVIRLKNVSMRNYDIEMWRYSRELKRVSEDPILGHEHRPSARAVLQSVEIRLNDRGLRGGPIPPSQAGQRRILFLGSSITLGWGVAEEETMTARLDALLRAAGSPAVVLNAGIGNYNAVRYVELFLQRLTDLQPTDIVVHYFVNDAEILPPPRTSFLLRNSQLAVTIWTAAQRLIQSSDYASLVEYYRALYRPESAGFKSMLEALGKLSDYANSHGIRVFLAMTPDIHRLDDYDLAFVHDIMRTEAENIGLRYIDLLPALRGLPPERIFAMPGDPHPNAAGHALMAEAIAPALLADR